MILSAHGVRGQVKLRSFMEPPEAIFSCPILSDKMGRKTYRLTRQGVKNQAFIVSIEGITDRNAAERLKGLTLFAPAPESHPTPANQWLHSELTGLEARLIDGTVYGRITGVHNFGAGDIVELERTGGQSEMLPFTASFIGEINTKQKFLIIFPPEYVETSDQEFPDPAPDGAP